MKRIVILGGGISGLSLLWNLKKIKNDHEIILIEKSHRVGGLIHTQFKEGFLFEKGPRNFQVRRNGRYTLKLIEELGLQDELIFADKKASQRFLYINKKLKKIPKNPLMFLFSSLTRNLGWSFLKEFKMPVGSSDDESIHQFFTRRLGEKVVNTFVSALVTGIYAGDAKKLSMKACFPNLFALEKDHGSLIKGLFKSKKKNFPDTAFIEKYKKFSLASFKKGMETLPITLYEKLKSHILLNRAVKSIKFKDSKTHITLDSNEVIEADHVYSTLPMTALSKLFDLPVFKNTPFSTVAVVNIGYKNSVLKKEGFGYLIPPQENEEILGMIWDSSVFKEQNQNDKETRVTVMIGEKILAGVSSPNDSVYINIALKALKEHLAIDQEPHAIYVQLNYQAIPQYPVGYLDTLDEIRNSLPQMTFLGSSFDGVAVNDCIAKSYQYI